MDPALGRSVLPATGILPSLSLPAHSLKVMASTSTIDMDNEQVERSDVGIEDWNEIYWVVSDVYPREG